MILKREMLYESYSYKIDIAFYVGFFQIYVLFHNKK